MNKSSKIITMTISAIVVGGGGILAFTMYITEGDLRKSIWASITAMILTGLTGLASSVWQELEDRLRIYISNRIELWFRHNFSGRKRKYLEYIVEKYRYYDLRGRQQSNIPHDLAFDDLYVEPSIAIYQNKLEDDRFSVWNLFTKSRSEMINQGNSFVILGDPGSGKTTLIKFIALRLAKNKLKFFIHSKPNYTPIVLHLLQIKKQIYNNPNTTLPELVEAQHKNEIRVSSDWFDKQLLAGKCAVLLDGVDELADVNIRAEMIKWIQEQIRIYRKSLFIITSRPNGYLLNPLIGSKVFEIQPFTEDQVDDYIRRWYQAYELQRSTDDTTLAGVDQRATNSASKLIHILNNRKELKHLAGTPLLLSMIASVYTAKLSLPGRRYELYNDIITVGLEQYYRVVDTNIDANQDNDINDTVLKTKQKRELLEILAYHMMEHETLEIDENVLYEKIKLKLNRFNKEYTTEDFVKLIKDKSGLLISAKEKTYSFAHKTFQEYLASTHILNDQTEDLKSRLLNQIANPWWNETMLLFVAQTDATPIIEKLINLNIPPTEKLLLAKKVLEDASEIDPVKEEEIKRLLEELSKNPKIYQHYLVAETNLTSRIRTDFLHQIDNNIYIDSSLISIREYILFLNNATKKERYYYPDHWKHTNYEDFDLDSPIVGVRPNDASMFIKWLTEWDLNPTFYRLPSTKDIEKMEKRGIEITGLNRYWLHNSDKKIISTEKEENAVRVIPSSFVKTLFNDDLKRLDEIFEAFKKRGTPPKKSSVILDETVYSVGAGSGIQDKRIGSVELILRAEADRAFHGRRLLEKYELYSEYLQIEFLSILSPMHKYLLSSSKSLTDHLLDFPANPTYSTVSFDIGFDCTSAIASIQEPNIKRVFSGETKKIADSLSEGLSAIRDRKWASFVFEQKNDHEEFYYFLRWFTRITSLYLRSIILESSKTPFYLSMQYGLKDRLKDLLIGLIELESRIENNSPITEGILIVKEVKN